MFKYEEAAKNSKILALFETYSPKGEAENFLKYFQDLGCAEFWSVSFSMAPISIIDSAGYAGFLGEVEDTLEVDKINQSVYSHDGDQSYITNLDPQGTVEIGFDDLPFDAPDEFSSVTVRWIDRALPGSGNSGRVTAAYGGDTKTIDYTLGHMYAYGQLTWSDRVFTKEDVNNMVVKFSDGENLPYKRLTAIELVAQAVA
jgi:hypothetical protein